MAAKTTTTGPSAKAGKPAKPASIALAVGPVKQKSVVVPPVPTEADEPTKAASPSRTRVAVSPKPVAPEAPVQAAEDVQTMAVPAEAALPMGDVAPTVDPIVPSTNPGPVPADKKVATIMKTAEQFVAFSQANVEAFMKSSQIWTSGLQGLSKQMAANAQLALDETVSTMKAMTTVKSVKEAIELQTSLARATVEKAVAGTTKMTETSMKLAEETMAPITARLQVAAQSFSVAA